MAYGIALDLGTSGFRSHLVDLDKDGKILDTAITSRHPLPGANIMDHMHFWMKSGREITHKIIAQTIYDLISLYGKDKLKPWSRQLFQPSLSGMRPRASRSRSLASVTGTFILSGLVT